MDSLDRNYLDVFVGIDAKVNPRNGRGHRTSKIRHGSRDASSSSVVESFCCDPEDFAAVERKEFDDLKKSTELFFCRAPPP